MSQLLIYSIRLITGLGNFEISSPKSQPGTNAKSTYTLYGDSEELNRMVILTLARTIHIGGLENNGGAWLKEVVGGIMQNTPHAWPSHTLENFPQVVKGFKKLDFLGDLSPVNREGRKVIHIVATHLSIYLLYISIYLAACGVDERVPLHEGQHQPAQEERG